MGRHRTWTDDDLRSALEGARSMRQVLGRLGLRVGGGAYTTVRTRMEQLGLSPPSPPGSSGSAARSAWRRTFSEEDLEAAVARSTSLAGVFAVLDLSVGGGQWAAIRGLIVERGWSTAHWDAPLGTLPDASSTVRRFRAALAQAELPGLVAEARNRADVVRALGFTPRASLYRALGEALSASGLSTTHFEAPSARMRASRGGRRRRPLDELLVAGSYVSTAALRRRLIDEGVLEPRCARCGLDEWLGGPIPLQLDHIDGDRTNNRLDNLRLLCPNCHALTDTYCGRNIGRYAVDEHGGQGDQ